MAKNVVFVSRDLNNRGFWREELRLGDVHWINPEQKIDVKKTYQVRLRHRGELIDCRLDCFGDKSPRNDAGVVVVKLSQPTRAVAPGQSAAIYDGEVVLGGGIVSTVD
jgi:tRNA-specific 2-thiouridylase